MIVDCRSRIKTNLDPLVNDYSMSSLKWQTDALD